MYERCLFIGRFQPVHYGHIRVILWCLERCKELIIGVGSAQYSHTIENPFTAGERVEMLRLALAEAGVELSRVIIIPIPDVHSNAIWVSHVRMLVPRFDVVVSRNPLVVRLFREAGYNVLVPPQYDRSRFSATLIRQLMARGDPTWEELVPPSVARFIKSIGGVERLREVTQRD